MTNEPEQPTEIYVEPPRRAPKYGRFILVGALLGALTAAIMTYVVPSQASGPIQYASSDVFIANLLLWVSIGAFLGAIIAYVIDSRSLRQRSKRGESR